MRFSEAKQSRLSADRLRELLAYDAATGLFAWRVAHSNRVKVGDIAGSLSPFGYWRLCVDDIRYVAHRLAWLYVYGEWPANYIDHINGDRKDNRIENLRLADKSQNGGNSRLSANNKSGKKGAHYNKRDKRWQANIRKDRKLIFLGYFNTREEAHEAYLKASKELFGEFANAGT